MVQLSRLYMTTGKTIVLTLWTFVGKARSLLFKMLSRFVPWAPAFPPVTSGCWGLPALRGGLSYSHPESLHPHVCLSLALGDPWPGREGWAGAVLASGVGAYVGDAVHPLSPTRAGPGPLRSPTLVP